ncbi:MAG: DUF3422 domain-containing protein [Rhodospirillales bacterium]|nr:DUF3422 domain-containing protein [Rhodospirillales bacterium]MDE2577113.1 DUF3422 domain-containing protein [Rhodospirillales bacterium]
MASHHSDDHPAAAAHGALRDHPLRVALTNELHARPPEALAAPMRASHLAMLSGETAGERDRAHFAALCARLGAPPPAPEANHHSVDLGTCRMKWERHTEFSSYIVFRAGCDAAHPFADPAIAALPADWLAALPGERLVGLHLAMLPHDQAMRPAEAFGTESFVGARFTTDPAQEGPAADGLARGWTDFRVHGDGWGRVLVQDRGLGTRQAGRLVQRLVEIETYRMLALLALPVARAAVPRLGAAEAAVAAAAQRATELKGLEDDRALLEQLTRLAAEAAQITATTSYRFAAARAYYALVGQRVADLREGRIEGLQTYGEFLSRRLAPALDTCEAVAARQESLATRIDRAGTLLRTRVDVALQEQNAGLLRSMDQRARLQLRLQETVEGLSVVAITYYALGLVGHALEGLRAEGLPINVAIGTGIAVVPMLLLVWGGLHRLRRRLGPR